MSSMLHAAALAAPLLATVTVGWAAMAHNPEPAPDAPLACAITLTPQSGLLQIEGHGRATEHVTGTYHLEVHRAGAELRQSGPFGLSPGEEVTFSQITLNGPRHSIEATLSLTIGETTLICPETT